MEKSGKFRDFWNWLFGDGVGALVLALVVIILGILLYRAAEPVGSLLGPIWEGAVKEAAKVLMAVVLIQLLTRAWLWKTATDAFYGKLKLKEAISNTGICDFWWFDEIPWKELFEQSSNVCVVAITANVLFETNVGVVKEFLKRSNTSLRVALANPMDQSLMNSYDEEFKQPKGHRKSRIELSLKEISRIARDANANERVSIRCTSRLPKYSCYRFDDKYIFVPYLTKIERAPERIPALCFTKEPVVNTFLEYDLDYVLSSQGSQECSIDEEKLKNHPTGKTQ
jgi:hypothetical protein